MHWLLFRYLMIELIPSFFLGLLIFTMVLLMDKIMRIVELIITKGVPLGDVLKLFSCLLPNFFLLTLPIALLLSVLLTFSRLCADNELTAWKVAGVSLYQLLPPVFVFGILVFSLTMSMSIWVVPFSNRTFNTMMHSLVARHVLMGIKERVFFDEFPGIVVYVDKILRDQGRMEGVFIADHNLSQDPILYFAKEGLFYAGGESGRLTVILKQGSIHRNMIKNDIYQVLYFDTYAMHVSLDQTFFPQGKRDRKNEELTLGEYLERIRKKEARGENVKGDWIDFHNRLALPFACFVFCTLGIPLALSSRRAVRYTGFSLSIGVVLLYFILMKTGRGMVETGSLNPWLGAWIPNLLLGALGAYLIIQKAREAPIRILDWYEERVGDLLEWIRSRLIQREDSNSGRRRLS